jgi:signal transduction histidine kinase
MLRYQLKLEGSGQDWSEPADLRTANYPALTPGVYRFLVRAVSADGAVSATPATVTFTILQPVWQRWWFIAIVALAFGLLAYALYRYRVRRLIELERVRTRIATDLHDDVGSGLSRIAILSEVATGRLGATGPEISEPISTIAGASRELVDSMSDIVWAVNPKRDHLHDLTERMRRFASDTFTARDIEFQFSTPGASQDVKLGADLRRQVYLIFKESVNNIAKHSQCTEAEIDVGISGGQMILKLSDNGKGFDIESQSNGYGGNGLVSMRRRAESLGGKLEIVSQQGAGSTITLKVRV